MKDMDQLSIYTNIEAHRTFRNMWSPLLQLWGRNISYHPNSKHYFGTLQDDAAQPKNVLFTDSQSAILVIDDWQGKASHRIAKIIATCDKFTSFYISKVTIQWVPTNSDILSNEKADKLAKEGSRMQQHDIETPYETAKLKANHQFNLFCADWM